MALAPYTVCDVEEWVGGLMTVGTTCSLMIRNPPVAFPAVTSPPADRVVAVVSSSASLMELRTVSNANHTDTVLLPGTGVVWGCDESTPQAGPLFANVVDTGEALVLDKRLATVDNTLERPSETNQFASSDESCATVERTFLNEHACIIGRETCAAKRFTSATFHLNETMIREFYLRGGKIVYAIQGLRLESDAISPCTGMSRWQFVSNDTAACTGTVDEQSRSTIAVAFERTSGCWGRYAFRGNDRIRDIMTCGSCSVAAGVTVNIGDSCWQHIHADEGNVYDFTAWSVLHDGNLAALLRGNPSPISKWAWRGSPILHYPAHHPASRFTEAKGSSRNGITLLGRLGDTVDFVDLPSSVQVDAIAELVGADGASSFSGDESCGSPGEVANDPQLGAQLRYHLGTYDLSDLSHPDRIPGDLINNEDTKYAVWQNVALNATDQLRQRMSWALSQIFVVNVDGVGNFDETEPWVVFYDIFVRHAFGNFRDVLKEVSYSPTMALMLSYMGSGSIGHSGFYPDENYAREIMQLFTMGLWRLHDNGTRVTDTDGAFVPTYVQEDVTNFARGWTGLTRPYDRGNVEHEAPGAPNDVDPLRLIMSHRDMFPKTDLTGGYIGDGFPLCTDLPDKFFLRRGARYRYIGASPMPRKQHVGGRSSYGLTDNPYVHRLELHRNNSALYEVLCNRAAAGGGRCRFQSDVTLNRTLACFGKECRVDSARVVKLRGAGTRSNGDAYDVYFEHIRPACVDLSYFDGAVMVAPRYGLRHGDSSRSLPRAMCANPEQAMAFTGCCPVNATSQQRGTCVHEYTWEFVTLATAEARCLTYGHGWTTCAKDGVNCNCGGGEVRYGWEDIYSSNWSNVERVTTQTRYIHCSAASFGNFTLPDDTARKCQCRLPSEDVVPMQLCDMSAPTARIESSKGETECDISYGRFWSLPQACQMQVQVSREGMINMVDHIEGSTGFYIGNATMSQTVQDRYRASNALDNRVHTFSYSEHTEANAWWQVSFDQPRLISTITVHNRADSCSSRLFGASCRYEHHDGEDDFADRVAGGIDGFIVGISNSSCVRDNDAATNNNSCGGTVCEHVMVPTRAGQGHEYVVTCDPPTLATHAYLLLPGAERKVYIQAFEARGPRDDTNGPLQHRWNDTEFRLDQPNQFRVQWDNSRFPRVDDASCSGICAVHGDSCLCNVTVSTEAVFADSGSIPSPDEITAQLHTGAVDPALFETGKYIRCTSPACTSRSDVAVYWYNSSSDSAGLRMTADTIFAIPHGTSATRGLKRFRNVRSTVELDGGSGRRRCGRDCDRRGRRVDRQGPGFSFRNPPSFATRGQYEDIRDGEYEIEAMLDHYFNHPTTAAFVAKALIQRMITSNPGPRYIEVVATAFNTGRYGSIGSGERGDLAAVSAATFLDREAQSNVLEHDPSHGGLREPLIKVIHILRALELVTPPDAELVYLKDEPILEQRPYNAPSVFNFFQQ